MNFWQWMAGEAEIQLICADLAYGLQTMAAAGIPIRDAFELDGITVQFRVPSGKLGKLMRLAHKKDWECKIISRSGLGQLLHGGLTRPVLLTGLMLVLFAAAYLPSRVLFVRVEGNAMLPTQLILEKASGCGIGFGAARQAVRSQKVKDALLDAIPELQWAGVNTAGCVATITVRERAEEPVPEESNVSSIVAAIDGVITEITATKGTARFTVGQAVRAGDVLISGYTDCGFCIRAQRAEGEIFARTERNLTAVTLNDLLLEGQNTGAEEKYALIIGKKRINFYKGSGNSGAICDKLYKQYYITLPGGFQLPVSIVTETWIYGDSEKSQVAQEEASRILESFSDRYLNQQMTAGRVTEARRELAAGEGIYSLTGNYACIEMIGRQRNEGNLIGKHD